MAESERLRDRQTAAVLLLPVRDAGEGFAQRATAFFRDLNFSIMNDADLAVSAYCLKRCSGLRTLCFSVPDVFKEETAESST